MQRRRVQALVHGRVQGVAFREYTRRQAVRLGLSGWVRNRPDGTVETVFEGPATEVDELLAGLANLSLPFLDWNTLYWNVKISEADFESAKLDLVESITTALNEVDATCSAYVQARLTLEQTLAEHDRAARIANYYRERYEQGGAELKDYLEALASADSSALSALSAKYDLIRLESKIYKAMGGRYEPLGR